MAHTNSRASTDVTWPWTCTRCHGTVYHDRLLCRECERAAYADSNSSATDPTWWTLAFALTRWLLFAVLLVL